MNIFGIFEKKVVVPSMDYWQELEKKISMIDARVQRLEARQHLKDTGVLKILNPTPPTGKTQREMFEESKQDPIQKRTRVRKLQKEIIEQIELDVLSGWDDKAIRTKHKISDGTLWRIKSGHHPLSSNYKK